jgi:biotin synthase-like enzyme
MESFSELIARANKVFLTEFEPETWFGRCIFLSWYCDLGTCKFCFRSTIKHKIRYAANAKRTLASVLSDALISRCVGWRLEFLTGGYRIFSPDEMLDIIQKVSAVYGEKIWVNLGTMDDERLRRIKQYVGGVCASIETVNPELHNKVCPDKPIEPYSEMLKRAKEIGFKTSCTIVIGLGEKKEDFPLLERFISEHRLDRITFYALKPVKDTEYTESPEPEEYAWWIAKTRIAFPKLEIMAGLTPKKVEYAELLLKAGANAITKFPAIKQFNTENARLIEKQAANAGRKFLGSLTKLPEIDWDEEIRRLPFEETLKQQIKTKLMQQIEHMNFEKKQAMDEEYC